MTDPARRQRIADPAQRSGVAILYVFGSRAQDVLDWTLGQIAALPAGPSDVNLGVKALPGVSRSLNHRVDMG